MTQLYNVNAQEAVKEVQAFLLPDDISELYFDSETFNDLAGQFDNVTQASIVLQGNLIAEETKEILDGITNNDVVEILDGCIDVLVTTYGMLQKLQVKYGADVGKAMRKTGANNLTKFPEDELDAIKTVEFYANKDVDTTYLHNPKYGCYVIRNTAGKVMKPYNFVANDLSDCF